MLKPRGYATAIYGKWHLGHQQPFLPAHHGFDEYFGLPYSNDMWPHHPTAEELLSRAAAHRRRQASSKLDPDQSQLTTLYTERAVSFIERNASTPFFLYVPHTMPHVPLFVSDKFKGKTGGACTATSSRRSTGRSARSSTPSSGTSSTTTRS